MVSIGILLYPLLLHEGGESASWRKGWFAFFMFAIQSLQQAKNLGSHSAPEILRRHAVSSG